MHVNFSTLYPHFLHIVIYKKVLVTHSKILFKILI